MKYLKIAFGLMVVAGLMSVMAGPALAETYRWVGCVENAGKGQWEEGKCEKAKSGGNWETKEPAVGKEITTATIPGQTLKLEDTKAGTEIECEGGGAGKLNEKATGEITAASATSCKFVAGKEGSCTKTDPVTAKAVDLPWKTKVEEVGGEARNEIESDGAGEPGYAVECTVGGIIKITDTCEGPTSTSIVNRASASNGEGTVQGEFEAKSPAVKCSVGGAGTGVNTGIVLSRLRLIPLIRWWFLGITHNIFIT